MQAQVFAGVLLGLRDTVDDGIEFNTSDCVCLRIEKRFAIDHVLLRCPLKVLIGKNLKICLCSQDVHCRIVNGEK